MTWYATLLPSPQGRSYLLTYMAYLLDQVYDLPRQTKPPV